MIRRLAGCHGQPCDYLALTREGVDVGLLSHRALVNHVLTAMGQQSDPGPTAT